MVLAVVALISAPAASAETTTIDFDELPPGTVVNSHSGVNFSGEPTVFKPVHVATYSPKSISRKARRVAIRAAASLPGTLTVGRRRFAIDRRTRRYRVSVKRGRKAVTLRLVLRGGGRKTVAKLTIPRR